jgi:GlpG protein
LILDSHLANRFLMTQTNWIQVTRLPLEQNLAPLSRFLHSRGLVHRIREDRGEQLVEVVDPAVVDPLRQMIDEYLAGQVELPEAVPEVRAAAPALSPFHTPLSLLLIILSGLGCLLVMVESLNRWIVVFSFQSVDLRTMTFQPLSQGILAGEIWRLLTPAFIHFGFFHFLFNSLWVWDLGRRLELGLGRLHYLAFFVVTAIAANLAQYLWGGSGLFGGMSGVVYALVGYIWVRQYLAPHPLFAVPKGILLFMLAWLLLCMSGLVDYFIGGSVANAAHLGGLAAGAVWALVSCLPRINFLNTENQ